MKIKRKSPFTGKDNIREIDVTMGQIVAWQCGALIQNVMPKLSADDREFIMTGITTDDWSNTFDPEE